MGMRTWIAGALAGWSLGIAFVGPAVAAPQDLSLEQLLQRAREAQARAQAPLQPRVDDALVALAEVDIKSTTLKSLQSELLDLGPAAGPLLVPGLHPGEGVPGPFSARAERTAAILAQFEDLGTALALLDAAHSNHGGYARNALELLAGSPHRRVIADSLLPWVDWRHPRGGNKPILDTVSRLQGPECALGLLARAEADDPAGVAIALQALERAANPHAAEAVLQVLRRMPRFTLLVLAADYFRVVPAKITEDDDLRLSLLDLSVGLAFPSQAPEPWERAHLLRRKATTGADVVLQLLHHPIEFKSSSALRDKLWQWHDDRTGDRTQVLALLAKAGDKKAKRRYLEGANEAVQSTKRESESKHASALSRRAERYLEVGDANNAARDVQKALKIDEKRSLGASLRTDLHRTGAQAQAIRGRFKEAAEHLDSLALKPADRAYLRSLPAFREFMESKYADRLAP